MNKIKEIFNKHNLIFFICIILFMFFTLKGLSTHVPWRDESNAWNIAGKLNFIEILKIMKYQGHMFLWYVILKPFAAHNLFFPYSMQIINWIFVFAAVIILWLYSPFNMLTKGLITFSFPFFQFYPIVAREYGVGILLLFILTALYKKRLMHPYIYSILIFLSANIGSITLAGTSALGFIFLYDLFKDCCKRKIYHPLLFAGSMLILCVVTFYLQLGNFVLPFYAEKYNHIGGIIDFIAQFYCIDIFNGFCGLAIFGFATISLFLLLKNNLKVLFFLACSWIELFIVFWIYPCTDYHYYFLFIYMIMSYWIYSYEKKDINTRLDKIFKITFACYVLLLCCKIPQSIDCFTENAKIIVSKLKTIPDIDNYTIYSSSTYDTKTIVPYLPKIKYRFINGDDLYTFEYFKECYYPPHENYNLDGIYDLIDDKSLILLRHNLHYIKYLNTSKISIETIYADRKFYIGKIKRNLNAEHNKN